MTNHATPVVQVLVIEDDGDIRDYVHPMTGAVMFGTRSPTRSLAVIRLRCGYPFCSVEHESYA